MSIKSFELHDPWLLLLAIPALLALWWRFRRRRGEAAILFSSVARLKGLKPTLRQRARVLVPFLQALAVLGIVGAAARPRQGDARTVVRREGIAIEMVLDRSYSMEETMRFGGAERKKIDIVKDVFTDFIAGNEDRKDRKVTLKGRKSDLVGLTTFGRFTEESCPLVPLHEPLITAVKNLRSVAPALDEYGRPVWPTERQMKDREFLSHLHENPLNATAIGDGLERAVLSLVTAEEDIARGEEHGGYKIKGKTVILLTDGKNNAGDTQPEEAGQLASANGIRVYYVLLSETTQYRINPFTGARVAVGEIDEDELLKDAREVVAPSGGKAYLARSGDELRDIYQEIDKLERSELGKIEFRSYEEKYHWLLIPAIACAFVALFLSETVFRGIP